MNLVIVFYMPYIFTLYGFPQSAFLSFIYFYLFLTIFFLCIITRTIIISISVDVLLCIIVYVTNKLLIGFKWQILVHVTYLYCLSVKVV